MGAWLFFTAAVIRCARVQLLTSIRFSACDSRERIFFVKFVPIKKLSLSQPEFICSRRCSEFWKQLSISPLRFGLLIDKSFKRWSFERKLVFWISDDGSGVVAFFFLSLRDKAFLEIGLLKDGFFGRRRWKKKSLSLPMLHFLRDQAFLFEKPWKCLVTKSSVWFCCKVCWKVSSWRWWTRDVISTRAWNRVHPRHRGRTRDGQRVSSPFHSFYYGCEECRLSVSVHTADVYFVICDYHGPTFLATAVKFRSEKRQSDTFCKSSAFLIGFHETWPTGCLNQTITVKC